MKCKDAKKIEIVAFLDRIGYTGKMKKTEIWYCSPFRDEKTESFKVDLVLNRWIDFGTGQKGDLVDLVKLIYSTDTAGALNILSAYDPEQFLTFQKAKIIPGKTEPALKINHTQPIVNKALIQYLAEREIPLKLAKRYTTEVYYTANNKKFFSIGFINDKGGFELRNKYYKNCSSPKFYKTFKAPGNKVLYLFEGFFDFLSALVYYETEAFEENTIVLNSLSNLHLVIPLLKDYESVCLFLDNDTSGREAVETIKGLHPVVFNASESIYPVHKDFNEFLVNYMTYS